MTDLLERPKRTFRSRNPNKGYAQQNDVAPDAGDAKAICIAIKSLASQKHFTSNIPRAVIECIHQLSSHQNWSDGIQTGFAKQLLVVLRANHELAKLVDLEAHRKRLAQNSNEIGVASSGNGFLVHALQLHRLGRIDSALDLIYDNIDEMLLASKFEQVDQLLKTVDTNAYPVDILLALLTITLAAKHRLPHRSDLFSRIKATLIARGEMRDGLLVGLE